MHELHKFQLLEYFVVEFSVSCVVSSLVDATSPKPYKQVNVCNNNTVFLIIALKCGISENCFCIGKIYIGRLIRSLRSQTWNKSTQKVYDIIFTNFPRLSSMLFQIDVLIRILHHCFRYLGHCNIVVHAPFW